MRKNKRISIVLSLIIVLSTVFISNVNTIPAQNGEITVNVDGEKLTFDQPPMLINSRTMVPLRIIFEKLGATVDWEEATSTVTATKGDKKIVLIIDQMTAYVNNTPTTLDSPAVIVNSRTLVPIRFISEALGCTVDWNEKTQTVNIFMKYPFIPTGPEVFKTVECMEDTFVRGGSDNADKNFGTVSALEFKAAVDLPYERKVFMKFDVSEFSDPLVTNAKIKFFVRDAEEQTANVNVIAYEADGDWKEREVTYNNMPKVGKYAGQTIVQGARKWYEIDISEYVRRKIKEDGDKIVSVIIEGLVSDNRRLDFDSRESENKPELVLKYGGTFDEIPDFRKPELDSFELDIDPIENARKILAASKAVKTETKQTTGMIELDSGNIICFPVEDTYVRDGSFANNNFGKEDHIGVKGTPTAETRRAAFLKFDLSELKETSFNSCILKVYCTLLQDNMAHTISVMGVGDNSWNEMKMIWGTQPKAEGIITTGSITGQGQWYEFDVTPYIKERLTAGNKIISLSFHDPDNQDLRLEFGSKESNNPPELLLFKTGYTIGQETDDDYDYIMVDVKTNNEPTTKWLAMKTRTLASLKGFTPGAKKIELSHYGGRTDIKLDARGFFYTTKVGERWYMVDPDGHPFIDIGIVTLAPGNTPKETEARQRVYGTEQEWAQKIVPLMRELGFNSAACWSSDSLLSQVEHRLPYTKIFYFLQGFWSGKPVLITEWYVKGEDSGMPNTSGAGWIVKTQADRGKFYQNFALGLLESKSCVGFHWFKYRDNDPDDPNADPSNKDSNKGIQNGDYQLYTDLVEKMKEMNDEVYNLADYFDNKK